MRSLLLSLAIVLFFAAVSCKKESQEGPKQPKPIDLPAKSNDVISKSNSFGIDLFRVTAMEAETNMMLSPLSASTALTMLLNGCNGQTYDQIRDMMGYEGLSMDEINATYQSLVTQLLAIDPEIELALANAVWYRQDFQVKPPFLEACRFYCLISDASFWSGLMRLTETSGIPKSRTFLSSPNNAA